MSLLVDYLDRRLGKHLGSDPELIWHCPVCIDRIGSESDTPKLHLNVAHGLGHCFRCEFAFRSLEPLFRQLNAGRVTLEELRILRKEMTLQDGAVRSLRAALFKPTVPNSESLQRVPLPDGVIDLSRNGSSCLVRSARAYLDSRGATRDQIERCHVGFCVAGRYGGYLTFPVRQHGEQVYFATRFAGSVPAKRKANNPPKRVGHYSKATCLLGYDEAVGSPLVALVEGPFDRMAFPPSTPAVAMMGKTLTDAQADLVCELAASGTREVVIVLDADASRSASEAYAMLTGRVPTVSLVSLRHGDPWDNRDDLVSLLADRGEPTARTLALGRYRQGDFVRRYGRVQNRV